MNQLIEDWSSTKVYHELDIVTYFTMTYMLTNTTINDTISTSKLLPITKTNIINDFSSRDNSKFLEELSKEYDDIQIDTNFSWRRLK